MVKIKLLKHKLTMIFKVCNEEVSEMAVDISEAKRLAKALYDKTHDVKQAMITGDVATDLDLITKGLQLKVFEIDMNDLRKKAKETDTDLDENISGFLVRSNDQHAIFLNKKEPMIRKRFTIAHEIGHLKLNHLGDEEISTIFRDSTTSEGTYEKEVTANAFAAELLMPEDLVRYAYNLLNSMSKIARAFGVSEIAVRNRLKNLGVIDNG